MFEDGVGDEEIFFSFELRSKSTVPEDSVCLLKFEISCRSLIGVSVRSSVLRVFIET